MNSICIDVGAGHIACAIVDEKGNICNRESFLYTCNGNKEKFLQVLIKTIKNIKEKSNLKTQNICIGLPGNCKDGILLSADNMYISDVHIEEELKKYFDEKVFLENDAICALFGEIYFGKFKNKNTGAIITLGTGTGFGIFKNENDNIYIIKDETRDTFNRENMEYENHIISMEELKNIYEESLGKKVNSRSDVFIDFLNNKEEAKESIKKFINDTSIGIKRFSNTFNVKDILIGGGFSEQNEIFLQMLKEKLPEINIDFMEHKNDAGIIGASMIYKKYIKNI